MKAVRTTFVNSVRIGTEEKLYTDLPGEFEDAGIRFTLPDGSGVFVPFANIRSATLAPEPKPVPMLMQSRDSEAVLYLNALNNMNGPNGDNNGLAETSAKKGKTNKRK